MTLMGAQSTELTAKQSPPGLEGGCSRENPLRL